MSPSTKNHILLVDDEKSLLISLRDHLLHAGFDVTIARSGEEAMKKLEEMEPDLIILDISMPGMGGIGFLKRISAGGAKPKYPVLVHTARSAMAEFFDTLDVDGFLAKPCDEGEMVSKIRRILAARQGVEKKEERTQLRILLAEDDGEIFRRTEKAFADAGYEIDVVTTGPEVIARAALTKPDVIVMKEILPRLNGSVVAGMLAVMPSLAQVPVIVYDETLRKDDSTLPRYASLRNLKKFVRGTDVSELLAAVADVV